MHIVQTAGTVADCFAGDEPAQLVIHNKLGKEHAVCSTKDCVPGYCAGLRVLPGETLASADQNVSALPERVSCGENDSLSHMPPNARARVPLGLLFTRDFQ